MKSAIHLATAMFHGHYQLTLTFLNPIKLLGGIHNLCQRRRIHRPFSPSFCHNNVVAILSKRAIV